MKIIKIEKENVSNGPGIRTVVWVSGCDNHCKGCHNPETWNYELGDPLNSKHFQDIIEYTDKPYISGITFTGGDPLSEKNIIYTILLAKDIKERLPNKNIWVWTGRQFEDISMIPGLEVFDIIVDGKFEIDKLSYTLPWRGSTNQRIVDVKQSLKSKHVISGGDELC